MTNTPNTTDSDKLLDALKQMSPEKLAALEVLLAPKGPKTPKEPKRPKRMRVPNVFHTKCSTCGSFATIHHADDVIFYSDKPIVGKESTVIVNFCSQCECHLWNLSKETLIGMVLGLLRGVGRGVSDIRTIDAVASSIIDEVDFPADLNQLGLFDAVLKPQIDALQA